MQLPPFRSDPLPYPPPLLVISALTSKLLRNSKFSQRHRVFLVFLYQIYTSYDFLCQHFPISMNFVFYAVTSFSIVKIEKHLWTTWFFFHFTYTHQISKKSVWKYRFPHHPLKTRSKLESLPKMEKAVTQKGIYRFSWNLNCIFD